MTGELAMPCERYKEILTDAAASGAHLAAEVRAHLAACTFCGEFFCRERALFQAIDEGTRQNSNAQAPSSLAARVRVRLDRASLPNSGPVERLEWSLGLAAATVLLLALLAFLHTPASMGPEVHDGALPSTKQEDARNRPDKSVPIVARAPEVQSRRLQSPRPSRQFSQHSAPDILISKREQAGFARLVSQSIVPESGDLARTRTTSGAGAEPLNIAPLQIAAVELTTLTEESAQSTPRAE